MRRTNRGMIASMMAMAGLFGMGAHSLAAPKTIGTSHESAITAQNRSKRSEKLPFSNPMSGIGYKIPGQFGLTPRDYGMAFGNGKSRKGKTNFNRLSHNFKVKRR